MEYNPNLLPPKKRPFVLAFFQHQPLIVCDPIQPQTSYEEDQVNHKTEEHCAKIDGTQFNFSPELLPPQPRIRKTLETLFREESEFGNGGGGGGSNCDCDYRPAKRLRRSENREEVEKLHALYNYIMEPESEIELCQIRENKLEEQKKKKMMTRKKQRKGAWSKTASSLSRGWKNLRREKVVEFGKENAKALFGKFWIGNESFKWDIQHYSDPLSLPNFRSFR